MKKKRAESAIPPQIKIVGYPCLISPKSFSMKKTNSYDYAIANDHVGKLLAEYLPSLLKEMGIEDIKHWIKRDLLLRHLVNVDLAKALNQAMTKTVAN